MPRQLRKLAAAAALAGVEGSFVIEFANNPGKCLDLPGGNTNNGQLLQLWDCNGSPNQLWDFDGGSWQIRPAKDNRKCVDAVGGVKGAGNKLQLWDCNGHDNQVWGYDSNAKTIYAAKSMLTGSNVSRPLASMCVDLPGGSTNNGNNIQIWGCNGLQNQKWLVTTPGPSPGGGEFCPSAGDLGFDYNGGGGKIFDQGWTIKGGARVHSRAAFNLLGGHVEFDLDVSGAHTGVNNNLYTISPDNGGKAYDSGDQYCDGQAPGGKFCMELDVIEANGNCGGATTIHTFLGHGGGCDQGGCQGSYHFNGQTKFHVKAEWDGNGQMTTYIGSQTVNPGSMHPYPDGSATSVVVNTMKSKGAVIQSSQWTGWVPVGDCGSSGDLGSSVFTVTNLRIKGTVVQGPAPRGCGGLAAANATLVVV